MRSESRTLRLLLFALCVTGTAHVRLMRVEVNAYLNEDFLERFEGTGLRMVLAPRSRSEVNLRVITTRDSF